MPHTIHIVVTVDAGRILGDDFEPSDDPNHPTVITDSSCLLIASPDMVAAGQATDRLTIVSTAAGDTAGGGSPMAPDTMRWRAYTMSGNKELRAIILDLAEPDQPRSGPRLTAYVRQHIQPVPRFVQGQPADPAVFDETTVHDYHLDGAIDWTGPRRFALRFCIVGPRRGSRTLTTMGYFEWPLILDVVPPAASAA